MGFLLTLLLQTLVLIVACSSEDIRFCSLGMGTFGTFAAKIAIEKGFKMVSAFTRHSKHTKTVAELLGIEGDESLSFLISDINSLDEIIDKTKPHFCIDATDGSLKSVYSHFKKLILKKVHIVTLADEAVYPNTRYDLQTYQLYKELDGLSKQNNVSIVGGGYSDGLLIPTIPAIAASMQKISKIVVICHWDLDRWSVVENEHHGAGLTQPEFDEYFKNSQPSHTNWQIKMIESIGDLINHPILESINDNDNQLLQVTMHNTCIKIANKEGLNAKALDKLLPFGYCAGLNNTVIGKANHGIEIIFTTIIAVLENKDVVNDIDIELYGKPNILRVKMKHVDGIITPIVPLLHRIPMILNELNPGFHNVGSLKTNQYWTTVNDWNQHSMNDNFVFVHKKQEL